MESHYRGRTIPPWVHATAYGVLEHWFRIDRIASELTNDRFHKNPIAVKTLIRVGIHQLVFTTIEAYAIVHALIDAAKTQISTNTSRFINGVLRSCQRRIDEWDAFQQTTDTALRWNIHPEIHGLLTADFPEQTLVDWYETLPEPSSHIWIRHRLANVPKFEQVESIDSIRQHLQAGELSIQDRSAGQVVEFMGPQAGMAILDYCAAPGGKATYIAELIGDTGIVVAADINKKRLAKVRENAARLKLPTIEICDTSELDNTRQFDQVLVDIPCSGFGTLKGNPDISVRFRRDQYEALLRRQRTILSNASVYVKPGGELILSTCTIVRPENEALAEWFASENPDFMMDTDALHCLPFDGNQDGAFAVRFTREN